MKDSYRQVLMTILNSKSLRRCLGLFLVGLLSSFMVFSQPVAAQTNFCETRSIPSNVAQGRSYGDPHINTFDGFHYGFQTVGEFILTYSGDRNFEVQARQSQVPNRDSLSLNTAVAMRVCDHRVGMYVQDSPDGRSLMWVDGAPINFADDAFALPNGGEVQRLNDRNYTVIWPSGDQVALKIINVSGAQFINIMPIVSRDHRNDMAGLLGNFNGNKDDDLIGRNGSPQLVARSTYSVAANTLNRALPAAIPVYELETAYLEQLNRQFGDSWRISQTESLFDYPVGMTTASFSNRGFPNQYLTLNGVSDEDLEAAIAECEAADVPEDQMDGCVFDIAATGNTGFADAAANAVANVVVDRVTDRLQDAVNDVIPGLRLPF
ncbi:MAG: VWD domain-containing protein [Leptolyngbyaceae cyanobacterium MAG.088]|nr:VWD domain-containing protein [Leptolyngbyaceae cyanobacterium MAG.088]